MVGHDVFLVSSDGVLYEIGPDGHLVQKFKLGAPAGPLDGSSAVIISGMNAGDGMLAVLATNLLVVYR